MRVYYRARFKSLRTSTNLHHLHWQELAELLDLARNVADADGTVMRRAGDVLGLDALRCADRASSR